MHRRSRGQDRHLRRAPAGRDLHAQGRGQERFRPGRRNGHRVPAPPTSASAGSFAGGIGLTGEICPLNGNAAGLPTSAIAQTDEFSGGQTMTEVPLIVSTSPPRGENVFGAFTARARAGFPGPNNTIIPNHARIALQIRRSGKTVFSAPNVDTKGGVKVTGLQRATYTPTWPLIDPNGTTRP